MATTKKNLTEEFSELTADDTSFAENDQREPQALGDPEARSEHESVASSASGYDERDRSEHRMEESLRSILSRYPQTDDSIRRIVAEELARSGKNYPPVPAPAEPAEVKRFKTRIEILRTFYPNTWV